MKRAGRNMEALAWALAALHGGCGESDNSKGEDSEETASHSSSGTSANSATSSTNGSDTTAGGVGSTTAASGGASASSGASETSSGTVSGATTAGSTASGGAGGVTTAGATATTANLPVAPCDPFELNACAGNIAGSVCHEDKGMRCGCGDSLDCQDGMNCDMSTFTCSSDPSIPPSCSISEETFCADDPRGTLCLEGNTGEYSRCGCVNDDDCPEDQTCASESRSCVAAP